MRHSPRPDFLESFKQVKDEFYRASVTKDFPSRVTCVAYRSENYDIVQLRKSRKQKQKPTSEQILAPLHYSGNAFPAREGEEEHIKPGDVVANVRVAYPWIPLPLKRICALQL